MANQYVIAVEKLKEIEMRRKNREQIYLNPEESKIFYRQNYREELYRDYIYRGVENTIATQYSDVIAEIKKNCAVQAQELENNEIPHVKEELKLLETLPRMSSSEFMASFPNVSKIYNVDQKYELEHRKQIMESSKKIVDKLLSDNKIDERNADILKTAIDNIKYNYGSAPVAAQDKNGELISSTSIYQLAYYKVLIADLQQNYNDELEKLRDLPGALETLDFINNIDKAMAEVNYNSHMFKVKYANIESILLIKNYNNYQQAKSNLDNLEVKCKNYRNALDNGYISTRINGGWYYFNFSELMTYGVIEQMLKTEGLTLHDLIDNEQSNSMSEAMKFKKLPGNVKNIFNKSINQLTQEERELLEKNYKNGDAIITQIELNNLSAELGNPEIIAEITPEMLKEAVKNFPDFKLNGDYENVKTI